MARALCSQLGCAVLWHWNAIKQMKWQRQSAVQSLLTWGTARLHCPDKFYQCREQKVTRRSRQNFLTRSANWVINNLSPPVFRTDEANSSSWGRDAFSWRMLLCHLTWCYHFSLHVTEALAKEKTSYADKVFTSLAMCRALLRLL